jgi:hypothetical protein
MKHCTVYIPLMSFLPCLRFIRESFPLILSPERCSTWRGSDNSINDLIGLERMARDKHSNQFESFRSYTKNIFYNISRRQTSASRDVYYNLSV